MSTGVDTTEYEAAKQKVSDSLLEFLRAADVVGRDTQVALTEVLGVFAKAAEDAQP